MKEIQHSSFFSVYGVDFCPCQQILPESIGRSEVLFHARKAGERRGTCIVEDPQEGTFVQTMMLDVPRGR
jgi:hypothetical protein